MDGDILPFSCALCILEPRGRAAGESRPGGEVQGLREKSGLGRSPDATWGVARAERVGVWSLCILQERENQKRQPQPGSWLALPGAADPS